MSNLNMPTQTPRIVQLAARIERDICDRHLQPGDAYLNTSEAARMLGVSSVMANRAMQLLAKRRILSRRQGAGAVVAEGILQTKRPPLRCVHFLVHQNYLKTEGLLGDGVLIAMQSELPGVDVRLNFLPNDNGAEDIARLIGEVIRSPEPEGFVLVRASLYVQRQVHASGLPAVIFGTPYPSVHGMAWIDSDQHQAGQLLAQHVLDRGSRRVLYLSRDRMLPGDQLFEDGLCETLSEANVPLSGLTTLYLPTDHETIRTVVGNRLKMDGAPVGIIARSEPLAEGAAAAAADLKLAVGRDLFIVLSNAYRAGNEKPVAFPHIRNAYSPQQVGAHLGRILALQASNRSVQPNHEIIPVELREAGT
jgi:GntR family transcriptional regulator, arabinose operon transcriptional repressor